MAPTWPLEFHADIFFAWTQRDGGIKDIEKPFRNHSSLERREAERPESGWEKSITKKEVRKTIGPITFWFHVRGHKPALE